MLNQIIINIKKFFTKVKFEEKQHIYHYKDKTAPSVSKLIHQFVEPVDWNLMAERVAKKRNVDVEDILLEWELKKNTACDRGHEIHEYAEQAKLIEQKRLEDIAVQKFWEDLPERYKLVIKELPMVHKEFMYFGTPDVLLLDTYTNKLIIADYKTNEDLFKNFKGKTLLEPFDFLLENSYNLYQLQLCHYQMMIEQLGYEISERWLIYFKGESYKKYKLDDYTSLLKEHYQCKQLVSI